MGRGATTIGAWHRLLAARPATTRAYFAVVGQVRSALPAAVSARVFNHIQRASWPDVALDPRRVRVGARTSMLLHPHAGEFDFEALVRPTMTYEADVVRWLEGRVDRYDAVLEIGANVGFFTTFLAVAFRDRGRTDARVIALEPSPRAFARLEQNLAANHLTNVIALRAAVADGGGTVEFFEPAGHLTNGSLRRDFAEKFSRDVTITKVPAITAADLEVHLAGVRRLLVKIDVEGAEPIVLNSIADLILRMHPDIVLEVLPGQEEAIMRTRVCASGLFAWREITERGAVPREAPVASQSRDWWLEPREFGA